MKRRMFVTTVVSGVATTVMAGCTESGDTASGGNGNTGGGNGNDGGGEATDTNTQQQTSTSTPESDEPAVKILDHSMEYDEMTGAKVVGTVKNTTDSEQGYIQVKARFFDQSGTRVGEGMWNATDVSAGREVQFETVPAQVDSEPAEYEVETSTSPS